MPFRLILYSFSSAVCIYCTRFLPIVILQKCAFLKWIIFCKNKNVNSQHGGECSRCACQKSTVYIGNRKLPNRLVMPPMAIGKSVNDVSDLFHAYKLCLSMKLSPYKRSKASLIGFNCRRILVTTRSAKTLSNAKPTNKSKVGAVGSATWRIE